MAIPEACPTILEAPSFGDRAPSLLGRIWRKIHVGTFFVFVAMTLHGVLAGTDTPLLGMKLLYGAATFLVTWLVLLRLFLYLTRSVREQTPG
jgi:hypothetical protein